MLKKGVSYLVLSSFLLMDSASCMEPEEKSPSSPRRSPRILIDTSESSVNPAPSSSSPSDLLSLDFQERLQAIFTLPWHERNRLYAELALKEDIPLALRRVALLYIDSMESLDEPTKERLENLIIAFLSNEKLINHQEILKMISWLAENDRNRLYTKLALQEDIPMVLRQEAFSSIYSTDSLGETTREGLRSLRTTFLNSEDLSFKGRFAFLPNLGEEAPPIVTLLSLSRALESADNESYSEWDIYRLTSFLMSYDRTKSQEGIETCFFKQPILFLDGSTYEEWLRTTLETGDERKRTSILQKLRELLHSSEDAKKVAAAIKFILQYSQDAGDKETVLETFFNIAAQSNAAHSEMSQEQSLRKKADISEACNLLRPHVPEGQATLLRTISNNILQQTEGEISAIVDPQERLQAISTLPWDEEGQKLRYKLLAELTLQEGIPMALRRETFSSIHSTDSLGEATREGLKSLRTTFLNDENLLFKDRFAFLPNANEETPPIATLSSLSRALESADNESYSEWDIYRLTSFLMNYDRTESQEGIETCFFKQPTLFLDGSTYEEWLRTTLETGDERKRTSILQKLRELLHSSEDAKKVAAAIKFILQYSQDAGDKETVLETFFNIATLQNAAHSEMPQEPLPRKKADISEACNLLLPHVPEGQATLLRTLSNNILQQAEGEISAIINPQERLQAISTLPWDEEGQKLRYKLLAELALQEGIPTALRRETFSSIHSTDSLGEATKEGLKSLRTTFLNDEEFPFKDRFAFLPNVDEEAPPIATLLSLTRALNSEADVSYDEWNIYRLTSFLMNYDRTESQEGIETCFFKQPTLFLDRSTYEEWLRTTLEASEEGKRASILQKIRDVIHSTKVGGKFPAAKLLLQYSQNEEDRETALAAFPNIVTQISAIMDPQERLQAISTLPWDAEQNLRDQLYAELALQEDTPTALRREAFSSIFLINSLDESTRERLGNLKATFLRDEELPPQERLKFLPNADEAAPSATTLLSLSQALKSANEEIYNEWDVHKLINFLTDCNSAESQTEIETCFSKQPASFLDGGTYEEWLRNTLETSDESKRILILQKLREIMQSTEDVTKIAAVTKFILQYSQDPGDKETALGAFFNVTTQQTASHSETPREQFLRRKLDISDACKALLPHVPEDKATLLRTLSEEMLQQVCAEISAIIDPQERLQAISALPWNEESQRLREQLLAELALKEDTPNALRREAFSSIYSTDLLDEATRVKLKNLKATFLNDEELPLTERLVFLPNPEEEEALPVATLLNLMQALEAEESDDEEIYDEPDYKYRLYHFLAECPDSEIQQGLKNYYFNHPRATAFYLKEWLNDFYQGSEENQRTLILQKMQDALQQATEMTFNIPAAAKFLLKESQDPEPTIQILWKLVERQTSNDSEVLEEEEHEEKDRLYTICKMVCKILLKYAPTSPVRESILNWLFIGAEQEISPEALVLLLTQEEPSINTRARELAEQRLDQDNLDYTLDLFFNLEQENLAQDLQHKIQEKLKARFNDPTTDKDVLLSLAPVFLRATDENLSQKAFNSLKQELIDDDQADHENIIYTIIEAFGADHPWAQEVINIGIGIEQIDHPFSAIGVYRQLLEKIKEPVIHHPSSTRLDDGRFVTFNIETLQTPRLLSHILPVQHSEFMALVEGLRKEVRENKAAKKEFSTISKNIPVKTLVSKANESYFKNLLDSEAGQGVISLISFKLRRLITDIQALKVEQITTGPSPSSSSMVTGSSTAPSQSGLSPSSRVIAQLLINVMQCDTNKDDGVDNTYRLLGYEKVISEEEMREERLIAEKQEHITEDLRQMREGLLNGDGPVVKKLLFGTKENHDRKVDQPPHQGKYLNNLLGGELGSFLKGQSISYDLYGGCVEEKLRSYTRQQALDTLYLYFKPEKVIERYYERFNKDGGKGHSTNLISALMGEEMFVMTSEGKMPNDKYCTFDPETWEFKGYTPLLVAEVLLRLNILREVQPPSLTIGAPSPSSSMPLPSSSTLPSEDSIGGP